MFVTALLAASLAAPVPKLKAWPCFYPYAVGTKWEYIRNGNENTVWTEEVTESETKDGVITFKVTITTDTGDKRFECYQSKGGEVGLTSSTFGVNDPQMLMFKDDMKAGDEWTSEWSTKGGGLKRTTKATITVGKPEELTTPAGKFTAIPVTYTYDVSSGSSFTNYFADGVGVVRQTMTGAKEPSQVLKSFTPGKGGKK